MNNKILLIPIFLLSTFLVKAQFYYVQNFDGADTFPNSFISIKPDTGTGNVWQIGRPQKAIFNSAATLPNALITDTINPYPINDSSTIKIDIPVNSFLYGFFALQWKQKLDFDSATDGGVIEYSIDSNRTWHNAFNNPQVYNFYGYSTANKMQLPSGEWVFSGTDSIWRDVWLCIRLIGPGPHYLDSVHFRFTLKSDSVNHNREGWMIDNMNAHQTIIHPIKEVEKDQYLRVYPRLTNGLVYIQSKTNEEGFKIESVELIDEQGRTQERFSINSNNTSINIGNAPNGWYALKVKTNIKTDTFKIMLKRE